MKYFLKTCYNSYKTNPLFGKGVKTLDLISIALISDDREYYAISNEFNYKVAWANEELRENVLKPMWEKFYNKTSPNKKRPFFNNDFFNYEAVQYIVNTYGKSNSEIAEEIKSFLTLDNHALWRYDYPTYETYEERIELLETKSGKKLEFYGYESSYDWVIFCLLFDGLPIGFPTYCIDLKQELDNKAFNLTSIEATKISCPICTHDMYSFLESTTNGKYKINVLKNHPNYPKQSNEHNVLEYSKWILALYKFLQTIK